MLDSSDMLTRCTITLTLDQFGVFKEKFRKKAPVPDFRGVEKHFYRSFTR